ncbi:palmitoyltransferase ZDHHC3 isoform X1 [Eurytemora carolleeae]|uniref:palmitoyltransferase ZDHHC3 isoform X1 n=1 Tax=Eurytemora carolleeae TaxID=1294199 RepID=UPI000C789949|nr:palmitoyltransferase ZDHHC3 isoform X1 [Eurytemora carolleeae]XP_023327533.1 palmitoyltransferase ZDHHC3 isoform X1 [Eurytemora carolleeae]|eukprot:XP_023327526.1 palmitoyltransferase ZDHHC3-like isoform X1 [Eurytemora affinis]
MAIFRKDPCGFFCILMTYGAVLYADYVVVRWIILQTMQGSLWGSVHVFLFNTIILLLFLSHARAVFSDPGIVPLPTHRIEFSDSHSDGGSIAPREDWTICTRCEMYRPPRAHHCRICKHCIRKMDHHCPWINNCVGERNQKYFIQFLLYVGLLSMYAVCLVAWSWYTDCQGCAKELMIRQTRILHSVLLVMESFLFGMFVIAIGCDQFEAILSDETMVEQVKKQGSFRPRKPKLALLAEVFGRGHPVMWVFPCETGQRYTVEPILNYDV